MIGLVGAEECAQGPHTVLIIEVQDFVGIYDYDLPEVKTTGHVGRHAC